MKEIFTAKRGALLFAAAAIIFGLTWSCDSGGSSCSGCSCMEPIPGGFDEQYNIDGLVHIRLTDYGITFLEQNLAPIVASFMGDEGLQFPVPETDIDEQSFVIGKFKNGKVCQNPAPGECIIAIDLCNIDLEPKEPNFLIVNALLGIHGPCNADFCAGQSCPDAKIIIKGEIRGLFDIKLGTLTCDAKMNIRNKPIGIPVAFKTDSSTRRTYFEVGDAAVEFKDSDYQIDCHGNDFGGDIFAFLLDLVKDLLKGMITDEINKQIDSMLADQLADMSCQKCEDDPLVCSAGTNCVDKECRDASNKCVPPPLGVEGAVNAGEALADFAPGLDATVRMKAVLGGGNPNVQQNPYVANKGLMFGMMGGADSDIADCVPISPRPPLVPPPVAPFRTLNDFDRGKKDANGNPVTSFHVGIGVSDLMLDHFLWSAFNTGLLCLQLDGGSIEQLTSGLFSLLVPSLKVLTLGESRPLMIKMLPQKPPLIDIGRGRFTTSEDADGNITFQFKEPLISIRVPDLSIDFYANIYERWARLFTMTIDLDLGIGLAFHTTDEGVIQAIPLLSDLNNAFQNPRITNNQLIAEDPEKLKEVIPTLLGMVMPMLTEALAAPFDLAGPEDLQGFMLNIAPEDVTGILPKNPMPPDTECAAWIENDNGDREVMCHEYLAIFAELGFDPNAAPKNITNAFARLIGKVAIPDPLELADARRKGRFISPHVVIETEGFAPLGGELEFAYRLDGGGWSPFIVGNRFKVSDPRLWLLGKHRIEVVSRVKGNMWSMSREPAVIEFIVDPMPPEVSIRLDYEGELTILARDETTPKESLLYSYSLNGEPFTEFASANRYDLSSPYLANGGAVWVRARVMDENGNIGEAVLGSPQMKLRGNVSPATVKKRLGVEGNDSAQIGELPQPSGCLSW
ncbi:MAG: hypothetical protein Kow0090_01250 [Myxococcota bacterium]